MMMELDQKQLWSELSGLGLVKSESIDFEVFNALIEEDRDQLQELLHKCEDSTYVANLSFDDLMRLPFETAKQTVDSFSMEKRINILSELDKRRSHYYAQMSRYGYDIDDEPMTAKEFKSVMGRIKHLEIVQNWLYGLA